MADLQEDMILSDAQRCPMTSDFSGLSDRSPNGFPPSPVHQVTCSTSTVVEHPASSVCQTSQHFHSTPTVDRNPLAAVGGADVDLEPYTLDIGNTSHFDQAISSAGSSHTCMESSILPAGSMAPLLRILADDIHDLLI